MRKLCHKVRNGQNLPHESPNLQTILFKVTLDTIYAIFQQVCDHITKTIFFSKYFLFVFRAKGHFHKIDTQKKTLWIILGEAACHGLTLYDMATPLETCLAMA